MVQEGEGSDRQNTALTRRTDTMQYTATPTCQVLPLPQPPRPCPPEREDLVLGSGGAAGQMTVTSLAWSPRSVFSDVNSTF